MQHGTKVLVQPALTLHTFKDPLHDKDKITADSEYTD